MNAITTILIGIDGSPDSRAAMGWAAGLAAACGASVHAVYAWSSSSSLTGRSDLCHSSIVGEVP